MTLPVRRVVAALLLGGALVTSGCGSTQAEQAAVVDGRVIPESEVQAVMEEFNAMEPARLQNPFTPSSALSALVQARPGLAFFEDNGVVASRSAAVASARSAGIDEPSEGTIEVLRFLDALQQASTSTQFSQEDQAEFFSRIAEQDVEVNPRYGTFDAENLSVAATLPSWVTPYDAGQ